MTTFVRKTLKFPDIALLKCVQASALAVLKYLFSFDNLLAFKFFFFFFASGCDYKGRFSSLNDVNF